MGEGCESVDVLPFIAIHLYWTCWLQVLGCGSPTLNCFRAMNT